MAVDDPLTRLFRACEPNQALSYDDPRYVNCDEVRGDNLVASIARSLRRAEPGTPEVKLFAGHRGVGKTSELFRLKHTLETPANGDAPFHVLYLDVGRTLDVNDLDLPDLLVFVAGEVQRQLREAQIRGFSATSTRMSRLWDDLKGALNTEIDLSGAEVGATGFGSLAVEFRNRPNARSQLREKVEQQSTNLLEAINDLLDTANAALEQEGYGGLVLIIDGLDKLVYRTLDGGETNTHDRLFVHRASQMASLRAHTIYTVPISLIYSPQCNQLEESLGEHSAPVAMIRIRPSDRGPVTPDTEGMVKLREIIEKRCEFATVDPDSIFDEPGTRDRLCEVSGGHPRHLLMFIQSTVNELDDPPITREKLDRAVRKYANSLLREVPNGFWPLLRVFDEPQDDIPKDDQHQQMLFYLHVFEYMNGQPWYEVNPVLRELPKFASGR